MTISRNCKVCSDLNRISNSGKQFWGYLHSILAYIALKKGAIWLIIGVMKLNVDRKSIIEKFLHCLALGQFKFVFACIYTLSELIVPWPGFQWTDESWFWRRLPHFFAICPLCIGSMHICRVHTHYYFLLQIVISVSCLKWDYGEQVSSWIWPKSRTKSIHLISALDTLIWTYVFYVNLTFKLKGLISWLAWHLANNWLNSKPSR